VGFLNPVNLLYGLALAVLAAIYLRARPRSTLDVSSTMLFHELPAASIRARRLRVDWLFWLEAAALGAIALALAGLYMRTVAAGSRGRSHALVFDLGASMGARQGGRTRLDLAKRIALGIVDSSPDTERFTVVGYAIEATTICASSADRAAVARAIAAMRPMAVAARRAALAAALMRSRVAARVDLLADRPPPQSVIEEAGLSSEFRFHQVGSAADNFAIVSLAPGVPRGAPGRIVLKNFSPHPHALEVAIDASGKAALHEFVPLGPGEQVTEQFGPLENGGLVRARILSADALSADNERYAFAPMQTAAPALVLSPDPAVRDDLARLILAVNRNFIVTAEDPADFKASAAAQKRFAVAVMHDCMVGGVKADSILLVYPPKNVAAAEGVPGAVEVKASVASALLGARPGAGDAMAATLLARTRIVALPRWMEPIATGTAPGSGERFPLAAAGDFGALRFGVIAFDLRNHLVLDPDRLEALVTVIDVVRRLTRPAGLRIVPTGTYLSVPASGSARVLMPDGRVSTVQADRWGRVRMRPLMAGHYRVESQGATTDVYANYFDASESDLAPGPFSRGAAVLSVTAATPAAPVQTKPRPLGFALVGLALLAFITESAILLRRAFGWGARSV
jgi:Aerotolerance regulator N-terminal